jgi:hypothetical protein
MIASMVPNDGRAGVGGTTSVRAPLQCRHEFVANIVQRSS